MDFERATGLPAPPLLETRAGQTHVCWTTGKIFRDALHMTDKRPTVPELLRVVCAG